MLAWSTRVEELQSLATIQTLIDRGDSILRRQLERFGDRLAEPLIVTALEPQTEYFAAVVRLEWDGLKGEVGNVARFTTAAAPPISTGGSHPRVLASSADIEAMRARHAANDAAWEAWAATLGGEALEAAASPGNVYEPRNYCAIAALLYLATEELQFRNAALPLSSAPRERFCTRMSRTSRARRDDWQIRMSSPAPRAPG